MRVWAPHGELTMGLSCLHRPAVKQVQEKVFTSDAFQDLALHPHLVCAS